MSQMKLPHQYVAHRLSIYLDSVWLDLLDDNIRVAALSTNSTQIHFHWIGLAIHQIEFKPGFVLKHTHTHTHTHIVDMHYFVVVVVVVVVVCIKAQIMRRYSHFSLPRDKRLCCCWIIMKNTIDETKTFVNA
jgi:hypothetical protein